MLDSLLTYKDILELEKVFKKIRLLHKKNKINSLLFYLNDTMFNEVEFAILKNNIRPDLVVGVLEITQQNTINEVIDFEEMIKYEFV